MRTGETVWTVHAGDAIEFSVDDGDGEERAADEYAPPAMHADAKRVAAGPSGLVVAMVLAGAVLGWTLLRA